MDNGYPIASKIGAENHYVGREASMMMGFPHHGQCSPSNLTLVGTWWSLSSGGQCTGNAVPSGSPDGCTWRIVERVKTIDGTCLFKDLAYKQQCMADHLPPWTSATATFSKAFSANNSGGGCDPIA